MVHFLAMSLTVFPIICPNYPQKVPEASKVVVVAPSMTVSPTLTVQDRDHQDLDQSKLIGNFFNVTVIGNQFDGKICSCSLFIILRIIFPEKLDKNQIFEILNSRNKE